MKPQAASGPDEATKTRIAMQMGAEMERAQVALSRPTAGEEAAELAGRASRAAVLAFIDNDHPETTGFPFPLVCAIAQQAYGAEWQRLIYTDREAWRA